MITGIDAIGDVPGLKSVASTQIAPASTSARAGGRSSAFISSAPGSSTAADSDAASGAMSSGCMRERWSTERASQSSATGTERIVESCSTCARSGRPVTRAIAPMRARCVVPERDRLDEDVERVDVALARQRLGLVHPGFGGVARRHGMGEQARQPHRLGTRAASSRPSRAARASPSRESP